MLKLDFLQKLGLAAAGGTLVLFRTPVIAADAAEESDALVGLWETTVVGKSGPYRYVYAISRGSWVCTGNIDESFQQQKYSPTMGSYVRLPNGSYRYAERGWVYDFQR